MELIESLGLTFTEHKVEFVEVDGCGDIAYGRALWAQTMRIKGVAEPIREEGKILAIFRKQPDGSWLMAVEMWNSDLPLAE